MRYIRQGRNASYAALSSYERCDESFAWTTICLWLIHALGPRSYRAQIHLGACITAISAGRWPPMSTTSSVNAMQREEDKRPERRAWHSIIVFRLALINVREHVEETTVSPRETEEKHCGMP